MTHLTREELKRWWDAGSAEDRARVLTHLAECDACGALYGEVIEGLPVSPRWPEDRGLVARAYEAGRTTQTGRRRWSMPALAGLAAAAALLVSLALPVISGRLSAPPAGEDDIRGSSLLPLAPVGTVELPVVFRWSSPIAASRYIVELREDDRVLFRLTSERSGLELPEGSAARLVPGRTYSWTVVAVSAAGEEMLRAVPSTFVMPAKQP
jgi:hypothetical protein